MVFNRRTLIGGIAALPFIPAAPGARAQQIKEVKIGLLAPLSGAYAATGRLLRIGSELAVKHVNDQGGIKSLGGAKLALVVGDAGDSPEKAANAAQRFLAQEPDIVGGIGAWASALTLAITEVTERAELPWLTLSFADKITERGFKYVFQTSLLNGSIADQVPPALLAVSTAAGKKAITAGIIFDNNASNTAFAQTMRGGALDRVGIKVVLDEGYTIPLSDATSIATKIRRAKPDFIMFCVGSIPDAKLLIDKMREVGAGQIPLIANGGPMLQPDALKLLGPESITGFMATTANWGAKGMEDVLEDFKKTYNEPWMTQESLSDYGHVRTLAWAIDKAGVADRRKVAEVIRTMDMNDGPARFFVGGNLRFTPDGRRVNPPLVICQWQNAQPTVVYPEASAVAKPVWRF